MKRVLRGAGIYVVLALIALLVLTTLFHSSTSRQKLSLTKFESEVAQHRVKSIEVIDGAGKANGVFINNKKFEVKFPAEYSDEFTTNILKVEPKIDFETKDSKPNVWLNLLGTFLPFVLIIGAFVFILNSMQGGGNRVMQFGKAKAKHGVEGLAQDHVR